MYRKSWVERKMEGCTTFARRHPVATGIAAIALWGSITAGLVFCKDLGCSPRYGSVSGVEAPAIGTGNPDYKPGK